MRLVFAPALAFSLVACASLRNASDGTSAGSDAGAEGSADSAVDLDGATNPDSRTGDGGGDARVAANGDPRWPLWATPADAPAAADYTIANGADGAIVTDTVTGLSWQDTVPAQSFVGPESRTHCDGLVYDGYSDWRAPTRIELVSIMSFSSTQGATTFTGGAFSSVTGASCFWTGSASQYPQDWWSTTKASIDERPASLSCALRCVRGGSPLIDPVPKQYLLAADTVTDPVTNLVWERTPPNTPQTWQQASDRCSALVLGGKAMRLPAVKELAGIVDETRSGPANAAAMGSYVARFFTSNQAWIVDFDNGYLMQVSTGSSYLSRCVSGP